HELGSKRPGWRYPSAAWVRLCQQSLDAESRLTAFLAGRGAPADPAIQMQMADLAQQRFKRLYHSAARLYRDAFTLQPLLAGAHRYDAARCAALAGCGQGKDAGTLNAAARLRWRRQALTWLRAELAARDGQLKDGPPAEATQARQALEHWRRDSDLAGVRQKEALARLPAEEQSAWQK